VREYDSNLGFMGICKPEEQFLTNQIMDILILDSYDISITDPFIQPKNCNKILVLVGDTTPTYIGDLYIHPGPETSWTKPEPQSTSLFLFGLEYLLIRKSLREYKHAFVKNDNDETKILITAGGSDPFAFSQNLVKLLSESLFAFHTFVLAPDFQLPNQDPRFELIQLGNEYERLLGAIDFVFTTAGTSSWEYHFLGIPIALASAVENQERNYRYQIDKNIASDLGYRDSNGTWNLNELLLKKIFNKKWRNSLKIHLDTSLMDGGGASKIIGFLT
jgi:spore coat polysaccharide biosynthesis predicted glycosyltransferase SpsG